MKRICAAALLLCCLLCPGCKKAESLGRISDKYVGKTLSCTARITAPGEYGGEFTVSFKSTPEGDAAEILSPVSVAGIKAEIRDGGALLSYVGKSLETPFVSSRETAPVTCLSSVFETVRTGAPDVRSEKENRLDYINGDVTKTLYFDGDGLLTSAEVLLNGETVLMIEVTSLTLE